MLGRFHHLPEPLWNEILAIAKDTTKPTTVRQAAINALSDSDSARTYFQDFVGIAQEPINLPSAAAIDSLEQLYASQAQGRSQPDRRRRRRPPYANGVGTLT
jgi:hypothetical protein